MTESTTIKVAVHDTLPEVLDRLRGVGDTPVQIEIPNGSPLFLTANEFRALRTAVDRDNLTLSIATTDPLRQQLASMFGLAQTENGQSPLADTQPNSRPPKQWTTTRSAPTDASALSTRETMAPARAADDDEENGDGSNLLPDESPDEETTGTRTLSTRTLLIGAVVGVIVVGALAFLASYFFLPRATVALELKREPLSDELILGVAPSGAAALPDTDLTVPAQPIIADVTVDLTIPATGEKRLPDKTAAGPIRLSNPTDEEITVPAGTEVTAASGVVYTFTDDVTVPSAEDGQPTFVDTQVAATGGGSTGNLEVGALSGKLDSGIYYSNRMGPIEGGTDRAVKAVGAADVEALRQQIDQALREQALQAFDAQLAGGEQVVGASIDLGTYKPAFDHQVDDEAETLGATATARVTAIKYNAAEAIGQAEEALRARLSDTAPDGFEFAPETLVLDGPILIDESTNGSRFRIAATASAVVRFPSDARDRLANDLKGKEDDEVAAIIQAIPGVESFDVSYAPGFLGERMPRVGGQIRIETDV
jgi:hypothetical protein